MKVQDRPNPIFSTDINDAIHFLESAFFQLSRIHVVFEMSIIERKSDTVQPEGFEELGIGIGEEILEKL